MFSKVFLLSFALTVSSSFSTEVLLAGDDTDITFPTPRLNAPLVSDQIAYRKSKGFMGKVRGVIDERNISSWFPAAAQLSKAGMKSFLESKQGVIVAEYWLMFQILRNADAGILSRYCGVDPEALEAFRSVFDPLNERIESFLIDDGFGKKEEKRAGDSAGSSLRSLPNSSTPSSSGLSIESVQARSQMHKHRGQLDRVVNLNNLECWRPLLSQVSSEGLKDLLEDLNEMNVAMLAEYWLMHEILAQCDPEILPFYDVGSSTLSAFNRAFEKSRDAIESALIKQGFGGAEKRVTPVSSSSPSSSRASGLDAIKVFKGERTETITRFRQSLNIAIDESVTAYGYDSVPYPILKSPPQKFPHKASVFVVSALPEAHVQLVLPCSPERLKQVQADVDARLQKVGIDGSGGTERERVSDNGGFILKNLGGSSDFAYITLSDDPSQTEPTIPINNIGLFFTMAYKEGYEAVVLQLDESQIETTTLQADLLNAINPWKRSFRYIGLQFPEESLKSTTMTIFKKVLGFADQFRSDGGA